MARKRHDDGDPLAAPPPATGAAAALAPRLVTWWLADAMTPLRVHAPARGR